MADNHKLMTTIVDLKCELNHVKVEKDSMCKSVIMLNFGNDDEITNLAFLDARIFSFLDVHDIRPSINF